MSEQKPLPTNGPIIFGNMEDIYSDAYKIKKLQSALLEEKQNTKELLNTIVKFKEYFSAIESGEYNNNRRPSPLREYENVLQLQANELIKKYGDV